MRRSSTSEFSTKSIRRAPGDPCRSLSIFLICVIFITSATCGFELDGYV